MPPRRAASAATPDLSGSRETQENASSLINTPLKTRGYNLWGVIYLYACSANWGAWRLCLSPSSTALLGALGAGGFPARTTVETYATNRPTIVIRSLESGLLFVFRRSVAAAPRDYVHRTTAICFAVHFRCAGNWTREGRLSSAGTSAIPFVPPMVRLTSFHVSGLNETQSAV